MLVAVLSDTHLRAGPERLPPAALRAVDEADIALHAGDLVSREALAGLAARAPLRAVLGNNDHELVGLLPESLVVELAGVRVGMIHDSGASSGRAARMRRRFPDADVVVFGHSHVPWDEEVDGQLLFNPGSPTQRRSQPRHTVGVLELGDGRVLRREIRTV